jgi:hypothetical protein
MVLRIPISVDAEALLRAKAEKAGVDIESYAAAQLERLAARPRTLVELSGPVADAVATSGMSEEELADLLETEKHAMRRERRATQAE